MASQQSNIRPLADRVLVEPIDAPEKIGEIWIPQTKGQHTKVNYRARVVALGNGRVFEHGRMGHYEFTVKVGDIVAVDQYGGVELNYDGKKYVLIRECLLGGLVEDPDHTSVKQFPDYTSKMYDDSVDPATLPQPCKE